MRDLPPVARRSAALCLALALFAVLLPGAVFAQDPIPVEGVFEVSGDSGPAVTLYTWHIDEPGLQWQLQAAWRGDEQIAFDVWDQEGTFLLGAYAPGQAVLYDLALEPGDYTIRVIHTNAGSPPFTLTSSAEAERYDPEPNDTAEFAAPLEVGVAVQGRLARSGGDHDYFAITLPSGDDGLRDIALESSSEQQRNLCLWADDATQLQCRGGIGTVVLPDLALAPGRYVVSVIGSVDDSEVYHLVVGPSTPRPADHEAEPNDDFATASAFDASLGVTGNSSTDDPDFHVVTLEGDSQLWQVRVTGAQIDSLSLVRGKGDEVARSRSSGDGSDAVLEDLYLVPGDHVFRVRTFGEDYALEMTPLGPPDPEAEHEPNDDDIRAEAYGVGERKTGRLPTDTDVDHYRFTLAAPDHLRLTLDQPDDADFDLLLSSAGHEVLRSNAAGPGQSIDLDLVLLPGDYLLRLRPRQTSEGIYALTTERLDPFDVAVDQEPNDSVRTARPVPSSLTLTGDRAGGATEYDWFALPPLAVPSTVTIQHSEARPGVWFYAGLDAAANLPVERPEDGVITVAGVPAGVPLYLRLQAEGPYQASLAAEGWSTTADPVAPTVSLELEMAEDIVAAYWPEGQRIDGLLSIANDGPDDLQLTLEATTSHYAWEATPAMREVSIAAGAELAVPIEVEIRPDAWADAPVGVSLSAVGQDGGQRSVMATLDASSEAPAVGSHHSWPVPDELLGGLNVAGLTLGAKTLGLIDAQREAELFDDLTPTGGGFVKSVSELPADFVVDLAGDSPVPVRGTILNPLAQQARLDYTPAHFELLLSTDGESWTSVLEEDLSPLPIDQAFVLKRAVPATHAMLRVHSVQGENGKTIALGEWKVIAQPGAVPDTMPSNIAEPIRGGHVARHAPYAGGFPDWYGMLDDETRRHAASFEPDAFDELEIIIGFQEGRAAQVTGLRWFDPDGSDEATRVDSIEVEVGLDGPLGPWESLGTWSLERDVEGSVVPFDLAAPVWARYVRLSAPLPTGGQQVEYPAKVEVLERTTDEEYRSILGEWGYTSDRGPYEWLVPTISSSIDLDPDAGDTVEEATPLALGVVRTDQAEILRDLDWYRVVVPEGSNTLTFDLEGVPSVGVRADLFDAAGQAHEMSLDSLPGGAIRYEAIVEPGDYDLRVEQPPFNVVFTFDTSGSMGPFLDFVLEGMREFASDVEPGRETVQIIPVGEAPLLDTWSDQPIALEDAVNNYAPTGNVRASNVEVGLLAAADLLRGRDGLRAILTVADAETGSLDKAPEVWSAFDEVQPIVYAVHVGASNDAEATRNLMRAWSDANNGVYSYPTTHAEMERSFERMSTRLRRPATYTLVADATAVNRDPASLSVTTPLSQPAALAPGVGIEIILDTSGSMRKGIDGKRRIEVAKASMRGLLSETLEEGVPVAIRIFGGTGKRAGCRTRLALPLAPLDHATALRVVKKLQAPKKAATPIAKALAQVPADLAEVEGSRIVVLITDGAESCDGDPEAAIAALRESGFDVNLNIVGFALDDEGLKAQMATWAEAGGGSYFDAASASELAAAITTAVSAPFRVFALGSDEAVAGGSVGGDAVELDPGRYRVEVLSDPPYVFEEVVLGGGESVNLEFAGPTQE